MAFIDMGQLGLGPHGHLEQIDLRPEGDFEPHRHIEHIDCREGGRF